MSPALDMPLNRRDALAGLGAMFLLLMGYQLPDVASAPLGRDDLPLTEIQENGIEGVSPSLLLAAIAKKESGQTPEQWRADLEGALLIAQNMTPSEAGEVFMAIGHRADALECRPCHGLGFRVKLTGDHPNQKRTYPPCAACNGTGRKDGGR